MTAPASSRGPIGIGLLLLGVVSVIGAGLASTQDATDTTRAFLCATQVTSLLLLGRAEITGGRGWATASFVVAAAWAALFAVPSIVYTIDPELFDVGDLTGTLAVVTFGTVGLLAGYVAFAGRSTPPVATSTVRVTAALVRPRLAVAGYGLGLLALCAIVANSGGPLEYLRELNRTAGANSGLFYVVAVLLLLRWVPIAILAQRWGRGERAGRWVIAALILGTILLGLTGARAFIAIAVVEVALLWTLLRRPLPTRWVLIGGFVVGLVIIFGLGTVKRYQSSRDVPGAPAQSFVDYATTTAPDEAAAAYVNNYVDTVRLMGLARATVPLRAPYEGIRPLKELVLKPVPSGARPAISRSRTIEAVFAPKGDSAYAVPIQTTALLSGGPLLVALVGLLIGGLVRAVDVRVLSAKRMETWRLVGLVAFIVQLPIAIRSGIPNGVALMLTEVLGTMIVARVILRTGSSDGPEEPVAADRPAVAPTPEGIPVT